MSYKNFCCNKSPVWLPIVHLRLAQLLIYTRMWVCAKMGMLKFSVDSGIRREPPLRGRDGGGGSLSV